MAGSSKKTRLLKRDEVPPYLRFNRYIHTGYRPSDLTWRECLVSLTYFHNETVNILTHLVVIFLSAWGLYVLPPWEEITLPYFPAILSIGVMSPWLGSSIYHLFMNHHLGESLYQTLLHIDMLGIWITQTVGAIPQMVAATRCLPWTLRWSIFTLYTLLSFYALVKVLRATDAWARRLAFQLLFIARVCLLLLRVSPYGGGHPDVALHVLCQVGGPDEGSRSARRKRGFGDSDPREMVARRFRLLLEFPQHHAPPCDRGHVPPDRIRRIRPGLAVEEPPRLPPLRLAPTLTLVIHRSSRSPPVLLSGTILFHAFISIIGVVSLLLSEVAALYSSTSNVIDLNPSNFDARVLQSDEVWVVEFYAPWCGHCQSLAPEYQKAATALKGVVKVGAVDAAEHTGLGGQYQVQGFPTIKIFHGKGQKPTDFQGSRTAQGIVDAALKALKDKTYERLGMKSGGGGNGGKTGDVIELTDSNFDETIFSSEDIWLVEFYAPWCGHCKNLAPHWAKAASELKGKVKLAAIDATANREKATEYGIQGFPTIKFFPAGKKKGSHSAEEYTGGRTSADIVAWALEKYEVNVEPPEIIELIDASVLKEACEEHPLCVISILPDLLDCQSKCRNKYLKTLRDLGEKFKQKNWGWVWTSALSQPAVEKALDLGGFGYPAMAVLNQKKKKFSTLRGSFDSTGIYEFLRDLSYGKGITASLQDDGLPKVVAVPAWDGQDAVMEVTDDIDLSDVILDDLDAKDEL
ncbi:unnamed protein product [Darwinula stevensoni]|uniref:Protein disulfide-isomerase A6 homolog n=1 Tax=Darwinula stevensoni TaxID=69355 RepID=A0A7R8XFC8_9CRUS|nr:unnamed protein product [Darwinula stevensoni]CAG0890484.1 unnamed protein product [Darwinula stevensoni]